MEVVNVREFTSEKIVFASVDDMKKFFDLVNNGQGVIFDYVDNSVAKTGEYVLPSIITLINDGKIKITSMEKK